MFERKHYWMIANVIRTLADDEGRIRREDLVEKLSNIFEEDNPRFDKGKFMEACYGED